MGETDEKENSPATTPVPPPASNDNNDNQDVEESKETDQMLKNEEKTEDIVKDEGINGDENEKKVKDDEKEKESKKVNGEEIIINVPEPAAATDTINKVVAEEREVKPKKIPIGGIKIPGFFTRNKDKSKNDTDEAENELLENAGNEDKVKEEEEKEKRPGFFARFKFTNPFARKAVPVAEGVEDTKENKDVKPDEKPAAEIENGKDVEKLANGDNEANETIAAPPAQKKGLLNAIKLPQLSNIIPKRFKSNNADDIEMGNGPNNRAGLASMETLDDSLKDAETKDTVDKSKIAENEKGADESAAENAGEKQTFIQRIRSYKCAIDDIAIFGGIIVFLILVAIIIAFTFIGKNEMTEAPIREGKYTEAVTSCGKVEGILEDGAFAFRGIPYAMPPTDERRWRSAELIENINYCWNDTLKAHNASNVCWQYYANGTLDGSEDCLTLDVITPHVRYENPLPVVVLIGADSFTGDSPNKLRPSTRYARARDVIFVRPNFRLGVLGFLSLDVLTRSASPPASGNYALSDIIAALKWIQLNIFHFGGNPNSVTLVGHRAGATLVSVLASSNKTQGLFTRAWVSSGAGLFPGKPLTESERANTEYLKTTGCADSECLREKDAEELLEATPDIWRRVSPDLPAVDENSTTRHEWLVLDGDILKVHPESVWNRELGPIKLVIGTTAHESNSDKLFFKHKEWTPELVRKHVEDSIIGKLGLAEEALKRYNATYHGLVSMISDIRTICPLLVTARKQPSAAFYVVTQTSGDRSMANVDDDIQAIMGRYEPQTPEQRRYVSAMQQLFYHYVSHGSMTQADPRRPVLDVGQDAIPVDNYGHCDFWITNNVVPHYGRLD